MIGIDIESVPRLARLLTNKPGIIRKLFSTYEWEYANTKANTAQTLTGIWCAKEAVVKAFSVIIPITITDVEISHSSVGTPYVSAILNTSLLRMYNIQVSISHTREFATAVAAINLTIVHKP